MYMLCLGLVVSKEVLHELTSLFAVLVKVHHRLVQTAHCYVALARCVRPQGNLGVVSIEEHCVWYPNSASSRFWSRMLGPYS
jgi:hypothetical protein